MNDYMPIEPVQDERRNLPSASGIERIMACPGSWQLEQQCPALPPGEDAVRGTLIHEALATGDLSKLSEEQAETALKCLALEAELLEKTFPGEEAHQTIIEERLWSDRFYSGKADRIHFQDEHALVVDFKTARGDVVSAQGNIQLRALAGLVWSNFGCAGVTVAIIQPWASPQVSVCEYGVKDLIRANGEIFGALADANKPNAPRIPGERQCKYCRAKKACPEYLAQTDTAPMPITFSRPGIAALSCEELSVHLSRAIQIERAIESIREEAKERMSFGVLIPGWRLRPGAVKSTITDVPQIWQRLKDIDADPDDFAKIVKVTKKDLTGLVKNLTELKGKALDDCMGNLLEGCTEEKQNAPSLERVTTQ